MVDSFDLVGKRKILVDASSYESVPRDPNDDHTAAAGAGPASGLFGPSPWVGSTIALNYQVAALNGQYSLAVDPAKDSLRVALGCNWEHRQADYPGGLYDDTISYKIFSNSWNTIKVFGDSPLTMESCSDPEEIEGLGDWGLTGASTRERIVLNCHVEKPPAETLPGDLFSWGYLMKTGIVSETGEQLESIVDAATTFVDHYHETFLPFHEEELLSKQPAGKAFYAGYSTYYNERIKSYYYESVIGSPLKNQVQNSIPSIYAFLRLVKNDKLIENSFFDLSQLEITQQNESTGEVKYYSLG